MYGDYDLKKFQEKIVLNVHILGRRSIEDIYPPKGMQYFLHYK